MVMQSQSQRIASQLEYLLDGKASAQRLMVFDSIRGNNYMLHFQRSQLNNGVNEAVSAQAPLLCRACGAAPLPGWSCLPRAGVGTPWGCV